MSTQKPISSSPFAGGSRKVYAVEQNPLNVAVDVPDIEMGDLILFIDEVTPFAKPQLFFKLTDGVNTDVLSMIKRNNYSGLAAPLITNDISEGYCEGSDWYDGTNLYRCVDCSVGAAVWIQIN